MKNKKMKEWNHAYLYYGAERLQNKSCTAERCNRKPEPLATPLYGVALYVALCAKQSIAH